MQPYLSLFASMRILYAEDEEGLRHSVASILELFFEKVFQAKDGEEAIEIFYEQRPDIVLLDICMPKMDGLTLLKEIRKMSKRVPVIIMSAHTDQNYLLQSIELNICKYLIKPFSKEHFLDALKTCAQWMYEWGEGYNIALDDAFFYDPINALIGTKDHTTPLTKKERLLFDYLLRQKNRTIPFEELELLFGNEQVYSKDALKALVKELRKKLPEGIIQNVFGIGYCCVIP